MFTSSEVPWFPRNQGFCLSLRRLLGRGVFRQTLVSQEPLQLRGIWLRDTHPPQWWASQRHHPCLGNQPCPPWALKPQFAALYVNLVLRLGRC
eukprot:g23168.t1